MKRFLGRLGFAVLPVDAGISNQAVCIMEETALKSDLGVYDRFVDAIVTGHLKSGAKLPTMQRIAEENGKRSFVIPFARVEA